MPPPSSNDARTASGASLPLVDVVLRQRVPARGDDKAPVFEVRDVRIDNRRLMRALAVDLAVVPADQRRAEVTIWIGRRFSRFTATVGRDDAGSARGPGLAAFEVYGDGRLLWKTEGGVGSARVPVKIGAGARMRTGAQPVDVSIVGVTRLRLVARYAAEINQEAPGIIRASGCAFAEARLYPAAVTDESVTTSSTAAGLTTALLRLAAATLRRLATTEHAPSLPVRLAIAPLPDAPTGMPRPPRDLPLDLVRPRSLGEAAGRARLGADFVFRPLDGRTSGRFERALRDNRGSVSDSERWVAAAVSAAREVGASTVLVPLLRPPGGGSSDGWSVELRLLLLSDSSAKSAGGAAFLPVEVAIVPLSKKT